MPEITNPVTTVQKTAEQIVLTAKRAANFAQLSARKSPEQHHIAETAKQTQQIMRLATTDRTTAERTALTAKLHASFAQLSVRKLPEQHHIAVTA